MSQGRRLLLLASGLALTAFAAGPAVMRELKISANQYGYAYMKWAPDQLKATGKVNLVLPNIDIYDPSGAIIYHGEKIDSDAGVLENLPRRLQGLHATGIHPALAEALEMVPDLARDKSSILSSGRYTVISVTSSTNCPKCALQDEAVAKLKRLNPHADINVLEVRLR